MKYKSIIYRVSALILMTICVNGAYAQSTQALKTSEVPVTFKLVDESGSPVENAEVIIGEGVKYIQADATGTVNVSMNPNLAITIKEPGYEPTIFKIADIENGTVELQQSLYLASHNDEVSLPFTGTTKRAATGDYIVISAEDLARYPSLDLRNALAALAPGLIVTENNGAAGSYTNYTEGRVSLSTRGAAPAYYIDDVLIDVNDMNVDACDVESVTIIKDVIGKAKFGPRAANGIVFIKTKRGKVNERVLTVNVEKGVQVVDRMPEVASAYDYARINNMARENDGMTALYSATALAAYAENDPNNLVYPANDFISTMFNDVRNYDKYSVSSAGGNEFAQYYASISYSGEGDNFAIGEKADYKNIAFRSNLDMKLNDIVSVEVGLYGDLKLRNSPYYANANLEYVSALSDARSTSPIAFPIYLPIETDNGNPVYGVDATFGTNPIAQLESSGYHQERGRTGSVNAALNFDFDALVEGLSSKTYLNLSTYNQTRIGKINTYDSRLVSVGDVDTTYTIQTSYEVASSESKRSDYYYQYMYGYEQLNYARVFGDHSVNADAIFSVLRFARDGVEYPFVEQTNNFALAYSFKNKYYFDVAVSYAGSMALAEGNKYRTFPSFGAAWILSDEAFMADMDFVNFFKVRSQYGIIGYTSDAPAQYQYESQWSKTASANTFGTYSGTSTNGWLGSYLTTTVPRSYYSKFGNEELDWQIRKDFSVGFDAVMLDNKLSFTANYYNRINDDTWTDTENLYSLQAGMVINPTTNYESTRYYGAEFYGSYTDRIDDFRYSIGASAIINRTERLIYDEPSYSEQNAHLSRVGKSTSVIYGYIYEGTYETDEEAQAVIQSNDATLYAGDFKYKDVNGDGVFDSNDMVEIGNSAADVYYTVNLSLAYKNFEFHLVGDGKAGYQMSTNSNSYFTSGAGDSNYSQYIVDQVDAGNYPRLTYTKVATNFLASEYWLVNRDYFKIQNIELAYNLSTQGMQNKGIRKVRFFVRAANLLTVSSLEGLDPESTTAGISAYPLNTTYTGGFNITF